MARVFPERDFARKRRQHIPYRRFRRRDDKTVDPRAESKIAKRFYVEHIIVEIVAPATTVCGGKGFCGCYIPAINMSGRCGQATINPDFISTQRLIIKHTFSVTL